MMLIAPLLSLALLAAHFSRASATGLVLAVAVAAALIVLCRRTWVRLVMPVLFGAGAVEWVRTLAVIMDQRIAEGRPYIRLCIILGTVAAFTLVSAFSFLGRRARERYARSEATAHASMAAFLTTFGLLAFIQTKIHRPMILLERFIPAGGWLMGFGLAIYAAWLIERLMIAPNSGQTRRRAWLLFSAIFFAQLMLGLAGLESFLMTGKLHLPVPAMILAGPLYRGEGLFMPILFATTLVLVGPAWCSYLCYVGSWDNAMATHTRRPLGELPSWATRARLLTLVAVPAIAVIARVAGLSVTVAAILGLVFGLAGVAIMVFISRRVGIMTHCVVWCPIGTIAQAVGRIHPLSIRVGSDCSRCGRCAVTCRYGALTKNDWESGRAGFNCTLCGDCLSSCGEGQLYFAWRGRRSERARVVFLVLVVALHATFMGVARI